MAPQRRAAARARRAWTWTWTVLVSVMLASGFLAGVDGLKEVTGSANGMGASRDALHAPRISDLGLVYQLKYVAPRALGVTEWAVGQFASYEYEKTEASKRALTTSDVVTYRLIADDVHGDVATEPPRKWLRIEGAASFRDIPGALYCLVSPQDLRVSRESPEYSYQRNYIPIWNPFIRHSSANADPLSQLPVVGGTDLATLVEVGKEAAVLHGEHVTATRYVATIDGEVEVELLAHPAAYPMGFLEARSGGEMLHLVDNGVGPIEDDWQLMDHVISGTSKLSSSCYSCHAVGDFRTPIRPPL